MTPKKHCHYTNYIVYFYFLKEHQDTTMNTALTLGAGAITAGLVYKGMTYMNQENSTNSDNLIIGGLNMQFGPYKISRISSEIIG